MEGGPAPGANSRQLGHSSSGEGAGQVAAFPQSLAEAQPQEEKAERRGLGPQALGPGRDSGLLSVGS